MTGRPPTPQVIIVHGRQIIMDQRVSVNHLHGSRGSVQTLWLRASIAGETHEYTDMYPGMAKTARDEGFDEIADWFETLAKAERSHANRFQKALDSL